MAKKTDNRAHFLPAEGSSDSAYYENSVTVVHNKNLVKLLDQVTKRFKDKITTRVEPLDLNPPLMKVRLCATGGAAKELQDAFDPEGWLTVFEQTMWARERTDKET